MSRKRGYQLHLSRGDSILKDLEGRAQKFRKILSVIRDFHPETRSLICADVGCSSGIIASHLAEHFSIVVGLDIDQEAVSYGKAHSPNAQVNFLVGDCMRLPLREGSVDVIVCNHVYEHVPEPSRLMDEIYRVLKEGGFCYFAAGNKYTIIEGHYRLPFLSWLPRPLAHLYLRLTGKGEVYYEEHLSLRRLKRLVDKFKVRDYTLSVIREPEKFHAVDLFDGKSLRYRWIRRLAPYLYPWIPTYIWVLVKERGVAPGTCQTWEDSNFSRS